MIVNANSVHIPLDDQTVHCVVTSPPYWGLRKYDGAQDYKWGDGWTGGLGLEPTPEMFIDHMVQIFQEVKRVLRDDGVAWVNMGDSYAGSGKGAGTKIAKESYVPVSGDIPTAGKAPPGLKPKDLVMIPHRLALALQADGWWVRSDVIWAKPNPMPESVNGWRWEQCKVKVKAGATRTQKYGSAGLGFRDHNGYEIIGAAEWQDCTGCDKCKDNNGLVLRRGSWRPTSSHEHIFMLAKSDQYYSDGEQVREGRNLRNVWNIPTAPYKGAHYATFPPELARKCVLSSTSRHACSECGMAWSRYDKSYMPSCQCDAGVQPCVVLDVFAGSGTVGQVCRELPYKRDFVGLDISYEYLHGQALLRSERITTEASLQELPMFADDNGGRQ